MGFFRKATFVATGGASGLFIKANSKKERTANATEKQLQLQQAGAARAAPESRHQKISAGAWWLANDAFKKVPNYINNVKYLGGWPDHPLDETRPEVRTLWLDADGLHYKRAVGTIFSIPWPSVETIDLETESVAESGATATEPADGDRPARTLLVVRTRFGDVVRMVATRDEPETLRAKMSPLLRRMAEGNARRASDPGRNGAGAEPTSSLSVADELAKLAALREAGVLSAEEFADQKARLLR